jgi:hypothetical protein
MAVGMHAAKVLVNELEGGSTIIRNHFMLGSSREYNHAPMEPAAGAPGAAPEGATVGTYLYLHVLGVRNDVAVPCLAW